MNRSAPHKSSTASSVELITNKDDTAAIDIMEDYDKNKALIEEYRKTKQLGTATNPTLAPIENILFSLVRPALNRVLYKCNIEESYYRPRSCFNGLDFLSEYCYNCNPRYPDRKKNWTCIFDMDWVKKHLKEHPRPYYPISLLMSKNTAAIYIQAHVRGYWVRKRKDLTEIRNFWKLVEINRDSSGKLAIKKTASALSHDEKQKTSLV